MTKLTKHKLSDLYTLASGISSSKEQAGHGQPFLSFSTAFNNVFLPDTLPDLMASNEKEQERHSIKCGDVFLTRTSEVVDELAISSVAVKDYPSATFSGFLKRLRPKEFGKAYPKYMALYLRSPLFRKAVDNNAVMTLRASFNEAIFSYLDVWLPDYDTQVEIGDLLYAIEEKITLNHKIKAELEAMAKLIYDYWFVQFDFPNNIGKPYKSSGGKMVWCDQLKREIPEGWGATSLWGIAKYFNGLAMQKHRPTGEAYLPVIKIREMGEGFNKGTERAKTDLPSAAIVENGDILFSWSATLEVMIWAGGRGALNQHLFKVTPLGHTKSWVYFQLRNYLAHLKMMAERRKTTMGHITQDHLKQSRVIDPPSKQLEKFNELVSPMLQQQVELKKQNQELANLRDWLLPLLMNGQVTVGKKVLSLAKNEIRALHELPV